jgi:hypothetical protein
MNRAGNYRFTTPKRKTMPDLLAHTLLAYGLATVLSARIDWLSPQYTTLAMVGAVLPDFNHISMLLPSRTVETTLSVPFDWGALQTGGPVLVLVLIGTVLAVDDRRRVFGLLSLGAASHLITDALITVVDGRSQSVLWPLTRYQPPSPGLYLSTDLGPLIGTALFAGFSILVTRSGAFDEE